MAVGFNPIFASTRHGVPATPPAPAGDGQGNGTEAHFWGDDGFTFGDLLDLVNPLQHIPVVSALYRAATGDDIATGPRILGGALFGGVPGLLAGVANSFVADTTGRDIGSHVLALLDGDAGNGGAKPPSTTLVAAADTTPTAVASHPMTAVDGAPAPEPPAAAAPADADENETAASRSADPAATPAWLARTPAARADFATLVARYGEQATPVQALEALDKALDKYEAMGGILDAGASGERRAGPGTAGLDTLI